MEVCIVGGGYSAIISAKVCLDHGLVPVVLNKSQMIGGLWKGAPNEIGVWKSITANNSKYITCFSDLPWDSSVPDYPTGSQFLEYLSAYISKHNISQYIKNFCEVTLIEKSSSGYTVNWLEASEPQTRCFNSVIIASGRNAHEVIPFSNHSIFKGTIIKGGDYREPSVFQDKNVLVIGRSFTASDIALDALQTAKSVSQIYRKPYLIIRKYLNNIPSDFFIFSVTESEKSCDFLNNTTQRLQKCKRIISLMGNPSEVLEEWKVNEEELDADHFNVSVSNDAYYTAVSQGDIKCIRGSACRFYEEGIELANGDRVPADVVVIAMGYQANYSFLSEEIKDIIQYDSTDKLVPVVLYRAVCHPALPGLCFVGNFSNHAPGFEVEAEMGVRYLIGSLQATSEEMWEGVRTEENIRKNGRNLIRAYDAVGFTKECLKNIGLSINYQKIKEELCFGNGPLLPCFYYMDRPGQYEVCRKTVQEIKEKYPEYSFT